MISPCGRPKETFLAVLPGDVAPHCKVLPLKTPNRHFFFIFFALLHFILCGHSRFLSGDAGPSRSSRQPPDPPASPSTRHRPRFPQHLPPLSLPPSLPRLHPPPSHPSGSSKYFPSLLFEASMGHGTPCTNHAGRQRGSQSERTGISQTRRNPICTVFYFFLPTPPLPSPPAASSRGYFSCQWQPSPISGWSLTASQRRLLAADGGLLAADFSRIPRRRRGEETESKFREADSLQWFNTGV